MENDWGSEAHRREQAEAALIDAASVLDALELDYVLYVKTAPGVYGRKLKFRNGRALVDGIWFVELDLGDFAHSLARIAAEEADRANDA